MNKNLYIFSKMRWFHWLETLLPIFIILNPIYMIVTGNSLMGLSLQYWMVWYLIALSFVIIIGIISYKKLGLHDFRFKLFVHMAVLTIAGTISGLLVPGFKILTIFNEGANISSILFNYIFFLMFPLLLIFIGGVIAAYSLTDDFVAEVSKTTGKFKEGDLNTKIEKKSILKDSVFGPIAEFINEITEYSKSLVEEVASTSQVIADTSNNLASGTEEVNSSVEEVSSTSQTMSDGASSQTEMIFEVNNKISMLQDTMSDIVKKIQINTDEVSQISLQTNILALNAGIEASRAGDYGRGFAVVAENVRKLSDQSKLASEKIEVVAEEIHSVIISTFQDVSSLMINVVSISEETASSAEEVAATTEEMTSTMEEISSIAQYLSGKAMKSNQLLSRLSLN